MSWHWSAKDKMLEMDSTLEMSESLWGCTSTKWSTLRRSHPCVSGWDGRWTGLRSAVEQVRYAVRIMHAHTCVVFISTFHKKWLSRVIRWPEPELPKLSLWPLKGLKLSQVVASLVLSSFSVVTFLVSRGMQVNITINVILLPLNYGPDNTHVGKDVAQQELLYYQWDCLYKHYF